MENRVKKKITNYVNSFKDDLAKVLNDQDIDVAVRQAMMQYITSYERLHLTEDDFSKRKRVKNHVPEYDRCCARRADGMQCTRKRKDEHEYCGTHLKGTPHGELKIEASNAKKKLNLSLVMCDGISHYTDENGKIYSAEFVLNNSNT